MRNDITTHQQHPYILKPRRTNTNTLEYILYTHLNR